MNPENTSFSFDPEMCYNILLLSQSYVSTAHFHDA